VKRSVILRTAARLLVPLMLLFSIFLLLRGHNETGGGFIGGLVAGISFSLYAVAYGTVSPRKALRRAPTTLMAVGLGVAVLTGLVPLFLGGSFLQGLWVKTSIGKLGSPVFFDVGVYLLVIGMIVIIVFELGDRRPGLFPSGAESAAPEG
jgi:multicomponent Na+:H+ antiporter subunit B